MAITTQRPLAIYYEHPEWFRPLFAELDRRGVPYERIHAAAHTYEVGNGHPPYALLFNRMSPSAYLRGHGHAILYTLQYLAYLEALGIRVVNGYRAFQTEISKASQLSLLASLGLPYPRARVIHHPREALDAAQGLRFPVVVKPNIGGSGAGVRRFDEPEALAAAAGGELDLGLDHTGLVQEFIPAEGAHIVRVEVLGGRFLYAIRVYPPEDSFNLCPADACTPVPGDTLVGASCVTELGNRGFVVENYRAPEPIARQVEAILQAAGIEVGGVEYVVDARDGQLYYYDINALSNFVADAPRVVGFDPFVWLVDYLERQAN
ncbi:MAG: hypothetical protein HY704_01175 [Gemmatimonadetes bacterium]|nr:hypothetical protein [Gemmatimonadota bacterium]